MKRVVVIGNSGAGKSTLATVLSARTGLPLIASDPFYWGLDWQAAAPHTIRQRVAEATAGDAWVIDGNFVSERDVVWARADTIVWLDYPLALIFWRVCRRNLGWFLTGQAIWSGNRMAWSQAWSGVHHACRTYRQKQATYPAFLAEFSHLSTLRFGSPREAEQWLLSLKESED